MSNKLRLLTTVTVILFFLLALYTVFGQYREANMKEIEHRKTTTELQKLNTESKKLETEVENLKTEKITDEVKLKELETEKVRLEAEKIQLEKDLQAKREKKENEARLTANPVTQVASVATPQVSQRSGDCSLVNNYSWDTRIAHAVCMAESGGNTNAANLNDNHGSCRGSFGLMQLGCIHASRGDIYSANGNMAVAHQLWSEQGWGIWGAYSSGAYTRYL